MGVVAEELDDTLSPYVDDEGVLLPMQTWLVTGKRAEFSVPESAT